MGGVVKDPFAGTSKETLTPPSLVNVYATESWFTNRTGVPGEVNTHCGTTSPPVMFTVSVATKSAGMAQPAAHMPPPWLPRGMGPMGAAPWPQAERSSEAARPATTACLDMCPPGFRDRTTGRSTHFPSRLSRPGGAASQFATRTSEPPGRDLPAHGRDRSLRRHPGRACEPRSRRLGRQGVSANAWNVGVDSCPRSIAWSNLEGIARPHMKALIHLIVVCAALAAGSRALAAAPIESRPVHFAKGASSATVKGTIKGDQTIDYKVRAKAGQAMSVKLVTRNGANYFNVLPPGSNDVAIFVGSTSGNEWSGALPSDGEYTVRVYLMRSAARRNESAAYTLTVAVTGSAGAAAASGLGEAPPGDAKVKGTPYHATGTVGCWMGNAAA